MIHCVLLLEAVLLGYIGSSVMIHLSDTARHSAMYCLFGPSTYVRGNLSRKSGPAKFFRFSGKAFLEWKIFEENTFPKHFKILHKHICAFLYYQSKLWIAFFSPCYLHCLHFPTRHSRFMLGKSHPISKEWKQRLKLKTLLFRRNFFSILNFHIFLGFQYSFYTCYQNALDMAEINSAHGKLWS